MKRLIVSSASALALWVTAAAPAAHVGTLTDTTPGTATNDGTVNGGEYVGSTTGINSGFGDVIGATSSLALDSSTLGALNIGLNPSNNLNDVVVIYVDSISGGVANTSVLEGTTGAPGDRAVSGDDGNGNESEISFAPGTTEGATFLADYAITIEGGFSGLYNLTSGSVAYVQSNTFNRGGVDANSDAEVSLLLSDLGLTAGDSFLYFATYLNSGNVYRSSEFQGVRDQSAFTADFGNVGQNNITLADGDYLIFESVPEPASLALVTLGGLAMLGRRRG